MRVPVEGTRGFRFLYIILLNETHSHSQTYITCINVRLVSCSSVLVIIIPLETCFNTHIHMYTHSRESPKQLFFFFLPSWIYCHLSRSFHYIPSTRRDGILSQTSQRRGDAWRGCAIRRGFLFVTPPRGSVVFKESQVLSFDSIKSTMDYTFGKSVKDV